MFWLMMLAQLTLPYIFLRINKKEYGKIDKDDLLFSIIFIVPFFGALVFIILYLNYIFQKKNSIIDRFIDWFNKD